MTGSKAGVPVETVTMSDLRLVDFKGKRRLWKSSFIDADGSVCVRLDFRNGQTRTFSIRQDMIARYASYGAERKVSDEIAGINDINEAVLAIDELITRLDSGEWIKRRD